MATFFHHERPRRNSYAALQGNAIRTSVTKSVKPENFVTWTLPGLHAAFEDYLEKIYGTENHPAHGEPPKEYFHHRLAETGSRSHRLVRFDRTFLIETCPSPEDGPTRIIDGKRGIKISYIWYQSDLFRRPELNNKSVEVRIDPWDAGAAFALIGNQWVECVSKFRNLLRRLTWLELRYALKELTNKLGVKKKELTQERIVEWLRILDVKNFDPRLAVQQAEARATYEPIGMAAVSHTPWSSTDATLLSSISSCTQTTQLSASQTSEVGPDIQVSLVSTTENPQPHKERRYDDDYALL